MIFDMTKRVSGGGGLVIHSPYKVISGQITPSSTSGTIRIPLGDSGITKIIFCMTMCDDYKNWSSAYGSYKRCVVETVDFLKANAINVGGELRQIAEITDSGTLDYWSGTAGHTISISGSNIVITSAKTGLNFIPQVPMNYIVIGT